MRIQFGVRSLLIVGLTHVVANFAAAQSIVSWANIGSDWATGANWIGGVAPANDLTTNVASFGTAVPSSFPFLAADRSVAGVVLASGAGTFGINTFSGAILTIGAGGIVHQDDSLLIVSVGIKLGAAASFTTSSSGEMGFTSTFDNNGFTLTLAGNGSGESSVESGISGSGGLVKSGTSTWMINGPNTYTGGTTINSGTLRINADNTLPATGHVVVDGTTAGATAILSLDAGIMQTIGSLTFGGAGATSTSTNNVTLGVSSTLTLGGTVTYDATNNPLESFITGGTLALGGNRTFDVGNSTSAAPDLSISSIISGAGFGLIKTGAGTLRLNGANTYTGNTTVNGGTLTVGTHNALVSTNNVVVNGTTAGTTALFILATGVTQTIGSLTFGGPEGTSTSTNNANLGSGTLTLGGPVTYDAANNPLTSFITSGTLALGATRTFDIGDSASVASDLSISAVISGPGLGLIKTGGGRLGLSGANTYTGATSINGGSINLGATDTLVSTSAVVINGLIGGATAQLSLNAGVAQTVGSLTFGGPGATSTSTNAVFLNPGAVLTLGGTVSYDATNHPLTASISNGTLELGGNRIFDIGDSSSVANELTITSVVSGAGFGLIKIGAGSMNLTGVNTYTGDTVVNGGRLIAGANNTLLSSGNLVVNGTTAGTTSIFALGAGLTQTVGSLTFGGSGATSTSTNQVSINVGSTLTLGGNVIFDATNNPPGATIQLGGTLELGGHRTFSVGNSTNASNDLSISSVIGGAGFGLTKTGAGTLALSGANTYSGGTTVSAGTLMVNNTTGSGVGTGSLSVLSGAILGGTGSIGTAATLQSGAHLAPGTSPGTLTFTSGLALDSGSILDLQLGSTSDLIRVFGGTLAGPASGTVTLNLSDSGGFGPGTYTLIDFTTGGTVTSNFDTTDFSFGATISGYTYNLAFGGSTLQLTASAIPEPSTYAVIAGAAALALAVRRRAIRRRRSIPGLV